MKWKDTCSTPHVERLVPIYNKTDVLGLRTFLRDKYAVCASNGKSVEISKTITNIVHENMKRFVPHKILRKIRTPSIITEIKRLKSKVRKVYNKRKLGASYTEELKQLSKQLLATKKSAQGAFLKTN